MSNVAYGRREVWRIRLRRFVHLIVAAWRVINQRVFRVAADRHVRSILVITQAKDEGELGDIVNRVAWGLPHRPGLSIKVLVRAELRDAVPESLPTPGQQRDYLRARPLPHISFSTGVRAVDLVEADLILTTRFPFPLVTLLPWVVAKLSIADPLYYSWTEGNVWKNSYYSTLSPEDRAAHDRDSARTFARLVDKFEGVADSYCFLTGPTFDRYREVELRSPSVKIICNSIVKNDEFLTFIDGPDVLTFADCVFHFGPSLYAAQFREKAVDVVMRYGCTLVVPKRSVAHLLAWYPELRGRIVGLDVTKRPPFRFPSPSDLTTFGTKSVSTYLMLPVASSLTERIHFLGADGRKPDEDYFWSHNPNVQFGDLMQSVFETHPSFFRDRVYTDDYDEYCAVFEAIVQYGEARGLEYSSVTPSYIPALAARPAAR